METIPDSLFRLVCFNMTPESLFALRRVSSSWNDALSAPAFWTSVVRAQHPGALSLIKEGQHESFMRDIAKQNRRNSPNIYDFQFRLIVNLDGIIVERLSWSGIPTSNVTPGTWLRPFQEEYNHENDAPDDRLWSVASTRLSTILYIKYKTKFLCLNFKLSQVEFPSSGLLWGPPDRTRVQLQFNTATCSQLWIDLYDVLDSGEMMIDFGFTRVSEDVSIRDDAAETMRRILHEMNPLYCI